MKKGDNTLAQLRAFQKLADRDLQYLVNEAYRILGNPIILCNLDWEILAYAEGVIIDDPIWNHHIHNRTITDEMKDFCMSEGLSEILSSANVLDVFHSDKLRHDRLIVKLFGKDGIIMAFAIMIAAEGVFHEQNTLLVEGICKKIMKEMGKIDRYKEYGQRTLEYYITKLMDTDVRNDRYAINYIEMVYSGLKSNLYVAVADIGRSDPTYAKLAYYKELFKRTRPAFKYAIYSKHIVIIMSTDADIFYPGRCLNRLNKIIKLDNIRIGISSRFENLFELLKHYNEAVAAITEKYG